MDILNKIKIRIRPKSSAKSAPIHVEIKEKQIFRCKSCGNQYSSHHIYCPQCLGEILPNVARLSLLKVTELSKERVPSVAQILKVLSRKEDFPFQKALQALPWIMIYETDSSVILHWKDILEAEKAVAETEWWSGKKPGRWKSKQPLFVAHAPLPCFFTPATDSGVREVARELKSISIRLKWADLVSNASGIVESFYKRNPSDRLLFSDYLFEIEQDLIEAVRDYHGYYRAREDEMNERIEKIKARLDNMQAEIKAVKRQVEDQL